MPDIMTHLAFAKEVQDNVDFELNRKIFDLGSLGPDLFLFYHFYIPPFRNQVNRYSSIMHKTKTNEFLMKLAVSSRENSEVFSYFCGFLCHYALDSTTHPFINKLGKNSGRMHMAIEHRIDKCYGDRIIVPPFLPDSMKKAVNGAMVKIYGFDRPFEKMRQGREDMVRFFRLAYDRYGVLNALVGWTHSRASVLSYKGHEADDLDISGFFPLYDNAKKFADWLVDSAKDYRDGVISDDVLRKIIGNRTYSNG